MPFSYQQLDKDFETAMGLLTRGMSSGRAQNVAIGMRVAPIALGTAAGFGVKHHATRTGKSNPGLRGGLATVGVGTLAAAGMVGGLAMWGAKQV